jgi:MFS family permease
LVLPVLVLIPPVARGRFDTIATGTPASTLAVLRTLFSNPAFRQFAAGASLVVLVGYGVAAFLPSFFLRVHRLGVAEVGLITGLINGGAAALGTLLGGFAADRFGPRDARIYGWLPAGMMLVATPCFVAGFRLDALWPATILLMIATAGIYTYIAPTFARLQSMVDARMRATAASILFLIINLIGLGVGPPLVGLIADRHGIATGLICVSLLLVWASAHLWRAGIWSTHEAHRDQRSR